MSSLNHRGFTEREMKYLAPIEERKPDYTFAYVAIAGAIAVLIFNCLVLPLLPMPVIPVALAEEIHDNRYYCEHMSGYVTKIGETDKIGAYCKSLLGV